MTNTPDRCSAKPYFGTWMTHQRRVLGAVWRSGTAASRTNDGYDMELEQIGGDFLCRPVGSLGQDRPGKHCLSAYCRTGDGSKLSLGETETAGGLLPTKGIRSFRPPSDLLPDPPRPVGAYRHNDGAGVAHVMVAEWRS